MRYEFDGAEYRKASTHQKEWGARLIDELRLAGNEDILDLGCGDGVLTARLAELVPHGSVLGIDSSVGMIGSAAEHVQPNLSFRLMDISEIDFARAFDVIFSNATLHWVKDHQNPLARVHSALRPGGIARFNFAANGNCAEFFEVVQEVMARPDHRLHFADFEWPWYMPKIEDYRRLLQDSPFDDARVWGENADRAFPSAESLTGWIDQPSIVPFLQPLPAEDRRRFRDTVVQRMIARTGRPDGTYFVSFRRINVFAVR